jgi:hypothetical protein
MSFPSSGRDARFLSTTNLFLVGPREGSSREVIAQLMGHAKVDTTLNVHTQVVDGSLRRAADTVGSELFTTGANWSLIVH